MDVFALFELLAQRNHLPAADGAVGLLLGQLEGLLDDRQRLLRAGPVAAFRLLALLLLGLLGLGRQQLLLFAKPFQLTFAQLIHQLLQGELWIPAFRFRQPLGHQTQATMKLLVLVLEQRNALLKVFDRVLGAPDEGLGEETFHTQKLLHYAAKRKLSLVRWRGLSGILPTRAQPSRKSCNSL